MGKGRDTDLELRLLREFELREDARPVAVTESVKRLLILLALKGPLARSSIAGLLWPDTCEQKANASLRTTLWRAQRLAARSPVATSSRRIFLDPLISLDVQRAQTIAQRILDAAVPCADIPFWHARSDLSAELLPGQYDDDWVRIERERYHQLRLHALEALCRRLTAARRYGEAVDAGLAAIGADPLRETAHRAVINAHLAAGNRYEAIRQYERCRRLLADELGLRPSFEIAAASRRGSPR